MNVTAIDVQQLARRSRRWAQTQARRDRRQREARDNARRAELALVVATYWGEDCEATTATVPMPPNPHRELYEQCLAGIEPAEVLPTGEREKLVAALWVAGWTDVAIAKRTRMTLYTTARIRARFELSPNEPGEAGT